MWDAIQLCSMNASLTLGKVHQWRYRWNAADVTRSNAHADSQSYEPCRWYRSQGARGAVKHGDPLPSPGTTAGPGLPCARMPSLAAGGRPIRFNNREIRPPPMLGWMEEETDAPPVNDISDGLPKASCKETTLDLGGDACNLESPLGLIFWHGERRSGIEFLPDAAWPVSPAC